MARRGSDTETTARSGKSRFPERIDTTYVTVFPDVTRAVAALVPRKRLAIRKEVPHDRCACRAPPDTGTGASRRRLPRKTPGRVRRIGDLNPGGCCHPTALAVLFFALRTRPRVFAIAPERRSQRLSRAAQDRDRPGLRGTLVRALCVLGACVTAGQLGPAVPLRLR